MAKVFISYSYVALGKGVSSTDYAGFGNMCIESSEMFGSYEEVIEDMTEKANQHCIKTNGMYTASTTILFIKDI